MKKFFPEVPAERYHHVVRVLAFLAEQKIATGLQIQKFCFHGLSRSFAWRTVKKLRQARLIESISLLRPHSRPFSAYQLTNDGFKELRLQSGLEIEEIQIKSNSPKHDITLTELRWLFSRVDECHYFVPENIIRSKLLEEEIKEIGIFRSSRCDSALQMKVHGQKIWLALEYERSRKALERYHQKIKHWYQSENLPGVLVVTENKSLAEVMAQIDARILPHVPRKILFLPMDQLQFSEKEIKFINSKNEPLTFSFGQSLRLQYPILNQSLAKS